MRIFVSDMQRAVDFYEGRLAIGVRNRSPDFPEFVGLATEGTVLALNAIAAAAGAEELIGRLTGITLSMPDVGSAYRGVASRGVRFSGPPARQPWGGILTTLFGPKLE